MANNGMGNAINTINSSVCTPQMVKLQGAGKAYQMVAQSMALAIGDATDYLRNMEALSVAATTVLVEQVVKDAVQDKELKAAEVAGVIGMLNSNLMGPVIQNFSTIGQDAATILKGFPDGS